MNSAWIVLGSAVAFLLAYRLYARFLAARVFGFDASNRTPAHRLKDGVDFVPTRKSVLFGHHFASIAGLGPLLGPALAVIWGWLPALLWVVFGSILIGAVHDLGALGLSIRHNGRSIGDVTHDVIGRRARILFLLLIYFLIALAMGVFVATISGLFKMRPAAVLPVFSLMVIAVVIGPLVYKGKTALVPATVAGVLLMLASIYLGTLFPIAGISAFGWTLFLLVYAYLASVLPVWLLLQPRDYLNSFQLYIGIVGMFLGVLFIRPAVAAPAVNHGATGLPPLFPFLFIVVACGAISGFHNLVSSGTTAKQLNSEADARFIGYGSMLMEGFLAVLVIVACTAGLGARSAWIVRYGSWDSAKGLAAKLDAFVSGAGALISGLGIPRGFAETFIATMAVAFAMTTLDSATRLLRYNFEELAASVHLKPLSNRFVASLGAVGGIACFALYRVDGKPAGIILWALFGMGNQLLAGLGLLTISVYLVKRGRPGVYTVLPMIFVLAVTLCAMVISIGEFARQSQWPLLVVGSAVLVMALWLVLEALLAYRSFLRTRAHPLRSSM